MTISARHDVVSMGAYQQEISVQDIAQIEHCSGCGRLTLSRYTWADEVMDPADVSPDTLYPERRNLDDLPEQIRERYGKMLELLHAPDVFAVRAGRLLETVCTLQGVPRADAHPVLESRLDALVAQGDVPQRLADQAHLVRRYRNIGSHEDVIEVEDADVPLIRGFVEALLSFLYWDPGALDRGRAGLALRQSAAGSGT